ncbi:MAG: carbonic anhydrase [Planctomycetota bacterium]|nr:carbonic anhydrase [Planctomycetota bacterium]
MKAREALELLIAGNRRFVDHVNGGEPVGGQMRLGVPSAAQRPFAIVLGCSDSRVPAEIVFDQGLGDLFVIRVAGNIVAPSQVGSVEFAAEQFETKLVVVMGHTECGAVSATLDALGGSAAPSTHNVMSIVNRILPSVEPLYQAGAKRERAELLALATRANIRASVNQLRHGSELIESLILGSGLLVVGAEYDLSTGRVEFLD